MPLASLSSRIRWPNFRRNGGDLGGDGIRQWCCDMLRAVHTLIVTLARPQARTGTKETTNGNDCLS